MIKQSRYWISIIVLVSLFIVQGCKVESKKVTPIVKEGTIDLQDWSFDDDGVISLDGEWEFYWNTFLIEQDSSAKTNPEFIQVPGIWNNKRFTDISVPGQGYASYRMLMQVQPNQHLAIKYLNAATACQIFINGLPVFNSGMPGKTIETSKPSYKPGVFDFTPTSSQVELIVQISNFHHKKGGLWEPILIGTHDQIRQIRNQRNFIELIFIGCVFMMALFHIILFIHQKIEKPLLHFGLFALFISMHFIAAGEFTIFLVDDIPWPLLIRIDYVGFYMAIIFFVKFIKTMFPLEINNLAFKCITVVNYAFVFSTILPSNQFTYGMLFFQFFTISISFYGIWATIQAIKNNRESAKTFMAGFVLLLALMVHEIMTENELLFSFALGKTGVTVFILFQASILAYRIRKALRINKQLSEDLKKQNEEYRQLNKKYKKKNTNLKIAKIKAEENDRFKSAFLANISHEIRTPMNGIIGFADLLSRKNLSDDKREKFVGILKERSKYLLNIVNDLIDISKIEAGQVELKKEKTNINEVIDSIFDSYFDLAKNKGVQLIKIITLPHCNATLIIDKQKLQQILENLVNNAVKFTSKGNVEFGYIVDNGNIQFYVNDNGIGISDVDRKMIFDRFHQTNNNVAKEYDGTGLGLAIVKGYVELLDSKIQLETKKGKGSKFHFSLPFRNVEATENELQNNTEKKTNELIPLLLVEDNMANAFLVIEILDGIANVIHAQTGEETIHICNSTQQFNLVLMDIKLPDINGFDLMPQVKAIRNVPIIAQTAYAMKGDKETVLNAGFDDYMAKPIDPDELIDKVKHYLEPVHNDSNQ